jgi:pimeloyl-ACP methyl ester carboxylesterase
MSIFEVPGAQLYYEIHGSGPLMLLIPGANGDANVFPPLTEQLSNRYTVATYDRRGFTRSLLTGPQDYARRLATDADDARRLIEHLALKPATVFGSSSGAIVALQLLIDHPTIVRAVVPYEPAAMWLINDGQEWIVFFHEVYDDYRRYGPSPALAKFRQRTFAPSDVAVMNRATDPSKGPHIVANATYWFERELREYTSARLDYDALAAHASQVFLAVGRESRGYPTYEAGVALGRRLGRKVIELPGGHVGYAIQPAEFAHELLEGFAQA